MKEENMPKNISFDEGDDFDCSFMEADYSEKFIMPEEKPSSTAGAEEVYEGDHEDEDDDDEYDEYEDEPRRVKKSRAANIRAAIAAVCAVAALVCAAAVFAVIKAVPAPPAEIASEEPTAEAPEPARDLPAPDQTQDIIDIIAASRLNGMTRRCYLTFDDGPSSSVTGQILDTLAKYGAKATFFEVGAYVDMYPQVTKRVYDEGHLVANHSYSHDYNALYANEANFAGEVNACQSSIENATGAPMSFKLLRFPGGSYNAGDHAAEKQICKETLKGMGYYFCDWNCVNGDAESASRTSTELVQTFLDTSAQYLAEGKNIVVLMHDSDAKQTTAEALDLIVRYMSEQGYTFHRLDDITV